MEAASRFSSQQIPIPQSPITRSVPQQPDMPQWQQHFSGLNLLYELHENDKELKQKNYADQFNSVLSNPQEAQKLTGLEDQIRLAVLFESLLFQAPYIELTDTNEKTKISAQIISDAHYEDMLITYGLTESNESTKAQYLFLRAVIFLLLSTDVFFGEKNNPPFALVKYAAGLMVKAVELDKCVLHDENHDFADNLTAWLTIIDGGGRRGNFILLCKELLFFMKTHPSYQHEFQDILTNLMPPEWKILIPHDDFISTLARPKANPPVWLNPSHHHELNMDKNEKIRLILTAAFQCVRATNKFINILRRPELK